MSTVITVAIRKGGCGKTTTVTNLAALMGQEGRRVLVVDMDGQANATSTLTGHQPEENFFGRAGLYDMLDNYSESMDVARYIHPTTLPNVDIIPSTRRTASVMDLLEKTLVQDYPRIQPRQFLGACLANTVESYDYILLDTPPAVDLMVASAVYCSDYLLCPIRSNDEYALHGLGDTAQLIASQQEDGQLDMNRLGVLLTMTEERTAAHNYIKESIQQSEYAPALYGTGIRKSSAVTDSVIFQKPVVCYSKRSNPAKDYVAVYAELKERLNAAEG